MVRAKTSATAPIREPFNQLDLVAGVSSVYARKLAYSDKVRAVVAIPDFEVSTEKARQALPPTYSRADVVRSKIKDTYPVSYACSSASSRCSIFSGWDS